MSRPGWANGVARVRLEFTQGERTLSSVFHVADLSGGHDQGQYQAIADNLAFSWAFGYQGHQSVSSWQGSDSSFVAVPILWSIDRLVPSAWRFVTHFLPVPGSGSGPALPPNMTAAVGLNAHFGGHYGRSWSFVPWLTSAAVDSGNPSRLTDLARRGLTDAFNGLIAGFQDNFDPFQFQLCVYHRDGRRGPGTVDYWDPVATNGAVVRSPYFSELRVRLPRHGRRGPTPRDR